MKKTYEVICFEYEDKQMVNNTVLDECETFDQAVRVLRELDLPDAEALCVEYIRNDDGSWEGWAALRKDGENTEYCVQTRCYYDEA